MLISKHTRVFILLILTLLVFAGCQRKPAFHYDFEAEEILDTLSWKCKTIFSISDKHATSGQKCLEMDLYPSPYPGIALNKFNPDWSNHKTLNFDIYNQEEIPLRLAIRIDDAKDPSYDDRYNHPVVLNPGTNYISIPLDSLITSGRNRNINLTSVQRVIFFLVQPEEKQTIYLDNVRLQK